MPARPRPQVEVPPPPPTRADDLVEVLHGIPVADPYRWLEDGEDPEVVAWVDAQNRRSDRVLAALPQRRHLRERLTSLLRAGSSVGCTVAGATVISLDRWGPHDQAVVMARSALAPGKGRVLVDPALVADDPTAAIDWFHLSPDGRLLAYGLSTGGDELSTLRVVDVETGRHLPDEIPHTRSASVAWLPDASAFAYTRYPAPGEVPDDELGYWRKVYWHRLGDPWKRDRLAWGELPDRAAWANVELSPDGRWLLVHLSIGWQRVDVHLVDRKSGSHTVLIEGVDAVSNFTVVGDRVVGLTTLDADRGRIVAAPVGSAWHQNWQTVVPESDDVIEAFVPTSRSLVVLSSRDAVARLRRFDHDGGGEREIALPGAGSLAGLTGSRLRDEAFLSFTSFATPPSLYRWAGDAGLVDWSRMWALDPIDGPRGAYVVEQVTYPSTDGTDVPMFLVRASSTVPGPDTPCVLTGYGGFAIALSPTYSAAVVAVCDAGGTYAVANIRGGAERGEAWHRAGMGANKQQSFDDFAAAADWLVATGYTSRERLAIRGGSNGGLLVGATVTQRPDLCRAAHAAVPLLDMVRYHRFLIARLWIPEYGDPDVAEDLAWLHAYSPYHRVVDGTDYPAVLLTTAEGDSRVDPMHARKMAARLQAATATGGTGGAPVLLRVEARAGHGQGKPVGRQADELADSLGFLAWQIGLVVAPLDPFTA